MPAIVPGVASDPAVKVPSKTILPENVRLPPMVPDSVGPAAKTTLPVPVVDTAPRSPEVRIKTWPSVAPLMAVDATVIADADDPTAVITPLPSIVMVVPSGLTQPSCEVVAVVHLITPAVIVKVEPSPSMTPSAADVAVGR